MGICICCVFPKLPPPEEAVTAPISVKLLSPEEAVAAPIDVKLPSPVEAVTAPIGVKLPSPEEAVTAPIGVKLPSPEEAVTAPIGVNSMRLTAKFQCAVITRFVERHQCRVTGTARWDCVQRPCVAGGAVRTSSRHAGTAYSPLC